MVQQKTDPRAAQKPRDFTVIKVMVALVLLIASVFALRAIGRVYATVSGFDAIYPAAQIVAIVALVLAARLLLYVRRHRLRAHRSGVLHVPA